MSEQFMELAIKEAERRPNDPVAGLGYIFAMVYRERFLREREANRKMFFVTINPKPDISLHDLKTKVEKYFSKLSSLDCKYAFEIRGYKETEWREYLGVKHAHGLHVHIMFKQKHPRYDSGQCRRDIYNSFKDMVGNNKHIDVRLYPISYWQDKEDYISGKKWDESKDEAVQATREWRKINNLKDIYVI